jgi:hypothetical protein
MIAEEIGDDVKCRGSSYRIQIFYRVHKLSGYTTYYKYDGQGTMSQSSHKTEK